MKKRFKLTKIIIFIIIISIVFMGLYMFRNKSKVIYSDLNAQKNSYTYEKSDMETDDLEYDYEANLIEEETEEEVLYKQEESENPLENEDGYDEEGEEEEDDEFNVGNSSDVDENQNAINISDMHKALKEVANSFYMRGPRIQYNSRKGLPSWYSPEEATSQNINYMVCSVFPRNTYYDLLNVNIPPYTYSQIDYAKENLGHPEVIAWAGNPKKVKDNAKATVQETWSSKFKEFTNEDNFILLLNDGKNIIKDTTPTIDEIIPYLQIRRCTYIYRS